MLEIIFFLCSIFILFIFWTMLKVATLEDTRMETVIQKEHKK